MRAFRLRAYIHELRIRVADLAQARITRKVLLGPFENGQRFERAARLEERLDSGNRIFACPAPLRCATIKPPAC